MNSETHIPEHLDSTPRPKCTCGAKGYGWAISHDLECPVRVDVVQRLRIGTGGTRPPMIDVGEA